MLTKKQLLLVLALADVIDDVELSALWLLASQEESSSTSSSECSSSIPPQTLPPPPQLLTPTPTPTSSQSMEQRPYFGQRDGHTKDALLEKELDWLAKEDRGRRLRVDRQTFHKLLTKLHPHLAQAKNGLKISAARRLAVTLRFLGTSSTLQDIKVDTHIPPQTLGKIIVETCECIIEALKDYIKVLTRLQISCQNRWYLMQ